MGSDLIRLQESVDAGIVALLDIQSFLWKKFHQEEELAEEIINLDSDFDIEPTPEDDEWLHDELVNNGDL